MPDVDPQTGFNYTPATTLGQQVFMFKMMAIGAVTLTQCLFYKWRKWQRQLQQRQQEPPNAMAIYAQFGDDNSPLGFDFDQLGIGNLIGLGSARSKSYRLLSLPVHPQC